MLLPDLRIKNYRLFKEFEIEQLARVTLVAGRNNTGKSALLETAYLVANQGNRYIMLDILESRGWERGGREWPLGSLFPDYHLHPSSSIEISAGDLFVKFTLGEEMQSLTTGGRVIPLQVEHTHGKPFEFVLRAEDGIWSSEHTLVMFGPPKAYFLSEGVPLAHHFDAMVELWEEELLLTSGEERVIEALRFLEPRVERLAFTRRDILVRLEGNEHPMRLGDLGGGMNRLLMIALLLVTSKDGVVLVDEIDTGLHYTVLIDLWRLVFQMAKRLNVQVLATTHSWDCIAAFSRAWNEVEESEGLYLRLDRKKERIRPVAYTAEGLSICEDQRIEVR